MASFSSARALLPAAHGVPAAALKAAATSGASFVVVCPAGARARAVVAALQAATKGAGLTLSSRVVACAAKRSGGAEDDRTGEDAHEFKATDVFFVGADDDRTGEDAYEFKASDVFSTNGNVKANGDGRTGEDVTNNLKANGGEDRTGEDVNTNNLKANGDDRTGEDFTTDSVKANAEYTNVVFVGAGDERTGEEVTKNDFQDLGGSDCTGTGKDAKPTNDVVIFRSGEMTLEELVVMFHKQTARNLKQVKHFPVGNDQTSLASLIASCDAVGEQIHKSAQLLGSPEGRPVVHSLIALHLRIFSCAGGAKIHKRGASVPDMWSGDLHRLPCKAKRDGSLMEVLLYSMMLADSALGRFISPVEWDLTSYD